MGLVDAVQVKVRRVAWAMQVSVEAAMRRGMRSRPESCGDNGNWHWEKSGPISTGWEERARGQEPGTWDASGTRTQ